MFNLSKLSILALTVAMGLLACGDVESDDELEAQSSQTGDETISEDIDGDAESEAGQAQTFFADSNSDQLFVSYHTGDGIRLFSFGEDRSWDEVVLPEPLRNEPGLHFFSVVTTDSGLHISTLSHGAWTRPQGSDRWQPFEPDWVEGNGRIRRLRSSGGHLYAYVEVAPSGTDGYELWKRDGSQWSLVSNDMFMIIDYIERPSMHLRATRYGTVQISYDDGESWGAVHGITNGSNPILYERTEDIIVVTTDGVWAIDNIGQNGSIISSQSSRYNAMMDDKLVLVSPDRNVKAVDLDDRSVRQLPSFPSNTLHYLDVAAAGSDLFISTGNPHLLQLSDDGQRWETVEPAKFD